MVKQFENSYRIKEIRDWIFSEKNKTQKVLLILKKQCLNFSTHFWVYKVYIRLGILIILSLMCLTVVEKKTKGKRKQM